MSYEKLIKEGLLKREEVGFNKVQKLVEKALYYRNENCNKNFKRRGFGGGGCE